MQSEEKFHKQITAVQKGHLAALTCLHYASGKAKLLAYKKYVGLYWIRRLDTICLWQSFNWLVRDDLEQNYTIVYR